MSSLPGCRKPSYAALTARSPPSPPLRTHPRPIKLLNRYINDAGEIVGNYPDVPQGSRVFVRSVTGAMTTFSVSDGAAYSTVATGINARGAIVFYGSSSSIDEAGGAI
jgi:hypothetical protein